MNINEGKESKLDQKDILVGVLFSQSGSMAVTERHLLQGTLLAISEINDSGGINGRKIIPIIENPESEPLQYKALAKKILTSNLNVLAIFGGCSSASRKAMIPVIERYGCLLFYPSFYEGFEYSPSIIYTGATPNQTVIPLLQYLLSNLGKRFYLVGSDSFYPVEINRIIKEFIEDSDASLVNEEYISIEAPISEHLKVINNIKASNADVVISTVVGADTINFYETYNNATSKTRVPIASLTTSEAELEQMNVESREGHYSAIPYFSTLNIKENSDFIDLSNKRFDSSKFQSVYSVTAYFQIHLFAQAMKHSSVSDVEGLISVLQGMKLNTPQGPIEVDSETNHINLTPRIGLSQSNGTFNLLWEDTELVKPDPYLVTYNRVIDS